ncbi:MAG: hypothetical protein ACYTGW_19650 [Planctomycetota bacterium]|jgi:hypothetical protein
MRSLFVSLTLCSAFAVAPLTAQRMGSVNRSAPKAGSFVEFTGGSKIEVSYLAISLAKGRFMQRVENLRKQEDKEQGAGWVERFNATARRQPLGKLKVTGNITLGGNKIPAGEYGLAFTLNEKVAWTVVLLDDDQDTKASFPLDTKAPKATARRLHMWLAADQGGANLGIAFGDVASGLQVVAAPPERSNSGRVRGATTRRRK